MRRDRGAQDSGAAAVELALVLPLLLLLVFGIIDFGRAFNARLTLTHAAREGVRVWALTGHGADADAARTAAEARTVAAAPGLTGVTATTTPCTFGDETSLTATADFSYLTPLISDLAPDLTTLSSEGVMRCGG